jgi:hypothetical protein
LGGRCSTSSRDTQVTRQQRRQRPETRLTTHARPSAPGVLDSVCPRARAAAQIASARPSENRADNGFADVVRAAVTKDGADFEMPAGTGIDTVDAGSPLQPGRATQRLRRLLTGLVCPITTSGPRGRRRSRASSAPASTLSATASGKSPTRFVAQSAPDQFVGNPSIVTCRHSRCFQHCNRPILHDEGQLQRQPPGSAASTPCGSSGYDSRGRRQAQDPGSRRRSTIGAARVPRSTISASPLRPSARPSCHRALRAGPRDSASDRQPAPRGDCAE